LGETIVIHKANRSWQELAVYAALALVMGVFFLSQINPEGGIPAHSELASATGQLAWMEKHKYGTRFGLVGIAENFNYPSKANGMQSVRRALERAGSTTISVKYSVGEDKSQLKSHDVWALDVGDQPIRTFEETRTAWEGDNRLIPWIGVMMLAIAFALGFSARRGYQLAQQPVQPDRREDAAPG
jgi:hypothetical protein